MQPKYAMRTLLTVLAKWVLHMSLKVSGRCSCMHKEVKLVYSVLQKRHIAMHTKGEFKSLPDTELPSTSDQGNNYAWLDHFWAKVSTMSRPEDSSLLTFPSLGKLAKIALVLPHSNADPERLFSTVKKVETSQRGHLKTSTTTNLISVNHPVACFQSSSLLTPELLKLAKGATMASLSGEASVVPDDAMEDAAV